MLAAQRQNLIMQEIERTGGVHVAHLTQLLGVSDMTVRRDIDALAGRGMLKKVYGGAIARQQGTSDEPGFEAKAGRERAAKNAIAAAAARLVKPGTAIAVSAGTTTHTLAAHLAHIPDLTVVTNSLRVADVLYSRGRSAQTVVLTGGVRTPSDALVGPVAVQAIRHLYVDCLFMGVHGMEPTAGFTTPNLMEAEMNRAMVASAGRLVVLADHTKWGVVGLCAMASLADAAVLVSDHSLSAEAREALAAAVGDLIIADEDRPPDSPAPGPGLAPQTASALAAPVTGQGAMRQARAGTPEPV
ncbi:MAG TPA: DeoR/GlpR family DNA-binding transcription regulator [Streptosporangiaceae bacterium]|nr:DeoR/GlpR family DNA-binding transcription regulator [Streptosporangiaceae bacterium]